MEKPHGRNGNDANDDNLFLDEEFETYANDVNDANYATDVNDADYAIDTSDAFDFILQ